MFGQELNDESYAICKADMLIKGQDVANIVGGNTLSRRGHAHAKFDYMLSNPPFGVEWKKVEKEIRKETRARVSTAVLAPACRACRMAPCYFSCISSPKMRPSQDGGSRFGIVLNGSPLFTGGAGSGESEIRRITCWRAIWSKPSSAWPTDMFYNTGISTYVWIVSNRKPAARKGKVQFIDASSFWQKMRKSLGSKRKEMNETHIAEVTKLFGSFVEAQLATVVDADGKEMSPQVVQEGGKPPVAPRAAT